MKKESLVITSILIRKQVKEGITIFENEETKLLYFSTDPFWNNPASNEKVVSCPDDRSAFDKIDIYPNIVICRLPIQTTGNMEIFRIYLRNKKEWLVNPEPDMEGSINFADVIKVTPDYIHVNCKSVEGKRVYVLNQETWIEVPLWNLGIYSSIKHFINVLLGSFQNRSCLQLTGENDKNPLSIFFLDRREYFSISTIPGDCFNQEHNCHFFNQVFSSYVTIRMGGGVWNDPDYFYIWRIKEKDYFSIERNGLKRKVESNKFSDVLFTEKHIAVLMEEDYIFEIVSTEAWKSIDIEFHYKEKRKLIIKPSIENGQMIVNIAGSGQIKAEL